MKRIFCLYILLFVMTAGYAEDKDVEIRDYNGIKLGSMSDYKDNSIKGVQKIDISKYRLKIDGLVGNMISLDYKTLSGAAHIKKVITLNCVEGWSVTSLWEGIPLKDIFAEVLPDKKVNTVIFYANDGYSTSLTYEYIIKKNIIIADKVNGMTLPVEQGYPFILIAEDKWGYKWCRWITRIELSANSDYKGFWETEGYNQNGDLSGEFY